MVYDARKGIRAKQVFLSFTDAVRDTSDNLVLTDSSFTGNKFDKFWGAYYGDLSANSVNYYITDLGFDSTDCSQKFKTNEYDSIGSVTTNVVTLSTETSMVTNAHVNEWVIIKKASGSDVFARIVSNDASTLTLDQDVVTRYGVAANDTIILLDVPFGLTMTAFNRLDHIATNFSLTEPKIDTKDTYFLGTSDNAGSQNMTIDKNPPSKFTGSITIRGGINDLARLKYNSDTTTPTGTTRYNFGSENTTPIGFTALWSTDVEDTDANNDLTKAIFCNDIIINKVGVLDSVSSDGKAEATVEFEVKGSNVRLEVYNNQVDNSGLNV